ncbi:sodium-coupled monocarboxylate transporter 2-like [Ruditapes philippinarum]|uniref:sodium-coupled monocarboxylate transporter 2-like n=1 Tax=Ruditapes philippinarum TaxID=129788 RepID=UPI00295C16F6|nr:sodium-coupled monocarboxylate transporter 2-like [Ruditapes philippinarum]
MGATGGSIVGVMFLGATFPQANWIGAFSGGIAGIAMATWLALCQLMYGIKPPVSRRIPTTGCVPYSSWEINSTDPTPAGMTTVILQTTDTFASETNNYFKYFNLSGMDRDEPTEAEYIFPGWRSVLKKTGYTVVRKPRTSTAAEMELKKIESSGLQSIVAPIKSLDLN